MRSDFMEFAAERIAAVGVWVLRFEFPYMAVGRKTPDRQPVLEAVYGAVAEHVRGHRHGPLVLGGKSMGGRIGSHVAASGGSVDGLAFFGYPLHPPGRPDRIRDAHLHDVRCPMLFVEGTRDPFCPLETLEKVRAGLNAPTELLVIEDGDHSLKVRKSSGRGTDEAWAEAADAVARWCLALS